MSRCQALFTYHSNRLNSQSPEWNSIITFRSAQKLCEGCDLIFYKYICQWRARLWAKAPQKGLGWLWNLCLRAPWLKYQRDVCEHAEADIPVIMLSFLFPSINILWVGSAHPPSFSLLLPSPTRLTLHHPIFPLRDPELHRDASPCSDTAAEDGIHLTSHSRKSINNRFLFFFPSHYPPVLLISSLCSSPPSLTPHPSLFAFCLFLISFPVKWPYQVPRYVSDAAPHVPTIRFGKEMSAKSRLQGRPSFSSTFFPVPDNLSPIGVNSSQCLCSAVFPRFFTLFC